MYFDDSLLCLRCRAWSGYSPGEPPGGGVFRIEIVHHSKRRLCDHPTNGSSTSQLACARQCHRPVKKIETETRCGTYFFVTSLRTSPIGSLAAQVRCFLRRWCLVAPFSQARRLELRQSVMSSPMPAVSYVIQQRRLPTFVIPNQVETMAQELTDGMRRDHAGLGCGQDSESVLTDSRLSWV